MNKKKFKEYLKIKDSGLVNMFDSKNNAIYILSEGRITRDDYIDIIKNFDRYLKIHKQIEDGTYNYLTNEVF